MTAADRPGLLPAHHVRPDSPARVASRPCRSLDGVGPVPPEARLVVTEGNYLRLDGPWAPVRGLLDRSWFVATPDAVRQDWLLARHMAFGRSRDAALAWIAATDAPNARLIEAARDRADLVVSPV